jgi:RimJ/RimL family protein N-acetyltransferase
MELAWTLRRSFWGRGYATESAELALSVAFGRLDQTRVISMIQAKNERSIGVAQRLRMRLEQRTAFLEHPVLIYGICRRARDLSQG